MSDTLEVLKELKNYILGVSKNEKVELETVEVEEPKAEEVKLEQMQLDDGVTVLEANSFEAGEAVFIVNEDERVALPVGEYKLSDGRVLVVEEEGVILSVGEAPSEEEEEMATDFVTKDDFNKAIDEIKAMLSKVEATETKLSEVETVNKELQEKLDNIPDAKPIKHAPETLPTDLSKLRPVERYRILKNQ